MFRVARRFHPIDKEQASLLGFFVVAERLVALVGEAACILISLVVFLCFAVGEETAVLLTLVTPAHLAASVEHADAATRNQDVELSLLDIATDVCSHDDELLAFALESLGVGVRRTVMAFAGKGELEALAALAAVGGWYSGECKSVFFAAIDRERNLAGAGGATTTGAHAAGAVTDVVFTLGVAGLGRVSARVFVPGAARHAAIPVTGSKSATACATLDGDLRATACYDGGTALCDRAAALRDRRTALGSGTAALCLCAAACRFRRSDRAGALWLWRIHYAGR